MGFERYEPEQELHPLEGECDNAETIWAVLRGPILITRFLSTDGVGELVDFMPVAGDQATDRQRVVRMLRVVRGTMQFRVACEPRFNYGRDPHELDVYPEGQVFRSPGLSLTVSLVRYSDIGPGEQDLRRSRAAPRAGAAARGYRRLRCGPGADAAGDNRTR
ncbi:hypothetical protein [Micromonospora sp. NPDC005707]|uniref:hypothetical protein n=1 Tax=Micromonospora sp. NPDC005707 TaxID=3157050 RepID=UPI0033E89AC7